MNRRLALRAWHLPVLWLYSGPEPEPEPEVQAALVTDGPHYHLHIDGKTVDPRVLQALGLLGAEHPALPQGDAITTTNTTEENQ